MLLLRLNQNGQTVELELPMPSQFLRDELQAAGLDRPLHEIALREVEYQPLNEQGKQLLTELSPHESIAAANLACTLLSVPDITASMKDVMESTRRLLRSQPAQEINFYCPLVARIEDEGSACCKDVSPEYLVWHEDEIRAALKAEIHEGENMADYIHDDALSQKIASAQWDVAKIGHTVYGKITCELRAPLTEDEQKDLIDWITGQNSDGLGEGWEQRPVHTDDGDLYVSLWHSEPGYYVLPEEEFQTQVLEAGQGFGEITMQ